MKEIVFVNSFDEFPSQWVRGTGVFLFPRSFVVVIDL